MRFNGIKKITACAAGLAAVWALGTNTFSFAEYKAGENQLINNETTPYSVSIMAEGKAVIDIPIGIGVRGDADESGDVTLYDAITIAKYLVNKADEGFEESMGYAMADSNLDHEVDLYDAINVAKYLITDGTHEEKWKKILGK